MKFEKFTQRQLKSLVGCQVATDITYAQTVPSGLILIGASAGKYGVNGALFRDVDKRLYAVTSRCANLDELL